MLEQRSHPRMQVNYEAYIQAGGRTRATHCRDISPKGVSVFLEDRVAPGIAIDLNLIINENAMSLNMGGFVRHVTANPDTDKSELPFLVGVEFTEESKETFPFMELQGDVMTHHASHTMRMPAPPKLCYELVWDYDSYPRWAKLFEGHKVKARYQDGRPRLIEWTANAYIRKVNFSCEYSYDDENLILSWVSGGGDLLENTGRWKFVPYGTDAASATFELAAAINFVGPNRIIRYFSTKAMRKAMNDFAKFVATKR